MTPGDDIRGPLAALAAEIGRAEATAAELEDVAGGLVAAGAAGALGLQGLDRLRQTLADLAAFAGALAATTTGAGDLGHAITTVRGRDIAARLAGGEPSAGEGKARGGEDEFWDF